MSRRILVTGGVRSGKSAYAERQLADEPAVTYLAPGPVPDPRLDPDWADRIRAHRERRPAHWTTIETAEIAGALRMAGQPVLMDCLGTWLTRFVDDLNGWARPRSDWADDFRMAVDDLVAAWKAVEQTAIMVTNEVGWGVVPATPSGRLFADLLGRVNQEVAAASDEVVLMVAGRPLLL
jgi:adenosylcobinamide kinase/adenosylcobinamide-phosphate guanylyltransferase